MNEIICGDALASLRELSDGIVQTCVTSPPYFGLRDYGTETILQLEGDDRDCQHEWIHEGRNEDGVKVAQCKLCNAVKYDHQIGLEDTPEAYIARLVEVFREVKRVLRDDGTLWVNIGDSYATSPPGNKGFHYGPGRTAQGTLDTGHINRNWQAMNLKPKDLIGIPWMLAFALRADGWYLRSDIIWHKPNCMPESVEDRPTKAHEYIFLLSKSSDYYYDNDAIREPHADVPHTRGILKGLGRDDLGKGKGSAWASFADGTIKPTFHNPAGRNKRSVWTVSTMPYSEAHFATFPPKLIEPCMLAGSSPRACEHCGAPWERVTEHTPMVIRNGPKAGGYGSRTTDGLSGTMIAPAETHTTGWQPTCSHTNDGTAQCIVLDPFCGAGTVPLVSIQHHRQYIGIELNPEYVKLINERIETVQPVLWEIPA